MGPDQTKEEIDATITKAARSVEEFKRVGEAYLSALVKWHGAITEGLKHLANRKEQGDIEKLNVWKCSICIKHPEREVAHAYTELDKDQTGEIKELIHENRELLFLGYYAPECIYAPHLAGKPKPTYDELLKRLVKTTNALERMIGAVLSAD